MGWGGREKVENERACACADRAPSPPTRSPGSLHMMGAHAQTSEVMTPPDCWQDRCNFLDGPQDWVRARVRRARYECVSVCVCFACVRVLVSKGLHVSVYLFRSLPLSLSPSLPPSFPPPSLPPFLLTAARALAFCRLLQGAARLLRGVESQGRRIKELNPLTLANNARTQIHTGCCLTPSRS